MALGQDTVSELRRLVGAENVLTGKEDLIPYSFDGTAALQQMPGCVVFAKATEQVAGVLKLASRTRTAIVTRGCGSARSTMGTNAMLAGGHPSPPRVFRTALEVALWPCWRLALPRPES